jgi:hypothetical protein
VHLAFALTTLAAQANFLEKLRRVPSGTWLTLGAWILAVIVIVKLWRGLKTVNDYAPYMAAVFVGVVLFLTMVYNRTEPRFLSPLVDRLTAFLPTKSQQERDLDRLRRSRE